MSASCVRAATAIPSPSDYQGSPVTADIGFIVYNELNYPDLTGMFARLGVETVASCMSFAVSADGCRFDGAAATMIGGRPWQACLLSLPIFSRHPICGC
jgi:predicted NAD/FAD-binding protein